MQTGKFVIPIGKRFAQLENRLAKWGDQRTGDLLNEKMVSKNMESLRNMSRVDILSKKKQSKKYRNWPFKLISFAGQSRSISWTRDSEEQCSGQLIQMTSLPSVASPSGWSYFKLFSVKWNHFGMTMKGFAHILVYITQIMILSMLRCINCFLDLQGVH